MRSRFKQFCNYLILNLCQSKTCAVASSISSLPNPTLKADTGASKTFIKTSHQHLLHSVTPLHTGPDAHLPDGTVIHPTSVGVLPFTTKLSDKA